MATKKPAKKRSAAASQSSHADDHDNDSSANGNDSGSVSVTDAVDRATVLAAIAALIYGQGSQSDIGQCVSLAQTFMNLAVEAVAAEVASDLEDDDDGPEPGEAFRSS